MTREIPLSIERLGTELEPYFTTNHYQPKMVSAMINVNTTNKPDEIRISHIGIYHKNKLVNESDKLNEIVEVSDSYNPEIIRLTTKKKEAFEKVKQIDKNEYLLFIPSFQFKRFHRRGCKGYISYLDYEFTIKQ